MYTRAGFQLKRFRVSDEGACVAWGCVCVCVCVWAFFLFSHSLTLAYIQMEPSANDDNEPHTVTYDKQVLRAIYSGVVNAALDSAELRPWAEQQKKINDYEKKIHQSIVRVSYEDNMPPSTRNNAATTEDADPTFAPYALQIKASLVAKYINAVLQPTVIACFVTAMGRFAEYGENATEPKHGFLRDRIRQWKDYTGKYSSAFTYAVDIEKITTDTVDFFGEFADSVYDTAVVACLQKLAQTSTTAANADDSSPRYSELLDAPLVTVFSNVQAQEHTGAIRTQPNFVRTTSVHGFFENFRMPMLRRILVLLYDYANYEDGCLDWGNLYAEAGHPQTSPVAWLRRVYRGVVGPAENEESRLIEPALRFLARKEYCPYKAFALEAAPPQRYAVPGTPLYELRNEPVVSFVDFYLIREDLVNEKGPNGVPLDRSSRPMWNRLLSVARRSSVHCKNTNIRFFSNCLAADTVCYRELTTRKASGVDFDFTASRYARHGTVPYVPQAHAPKSAWIGDNSMGMSHTRFYHMMSAVRLMQMGSMDDAIHAIHGNDTQSDDARNSEAVCAALHRTWSMVLHGARPHARYEEPDQEWIVTPTGLIAQQTDTLSVAVSEALDEELRARGFEDVERMAIASFVRTGLFQMQLYVGDFERADELTGPRVVEHGIPDAVALEEGLGDGAAPPRASNSPEAATGMTQAQIDAARRKRNGPFLLGGNIWRIIDEAVDIFKKRAILVRRDMLREYHAHPVTLRSCELIFIASLILERILPVRDEMRYALSLSTASNDVDSPLSSSSSSSTTTPDFSTTPIKFGRDDHAGDLMPDQSTWQGIYDIAVRYFTCDYADIQSTDAPEERSMAEGSAIAQEYLTCLEPRIAQSALAFISMDPCVVFDLPKRKAIRGRWAVFTRV